LKSTKIEDGGVWRSNPAFSPDTPTGGLEVGVSDPDAMQDHVFTLS